MVNRKQLFEFLTTVYAELSLCVENELPNDLPKIICNKGYKFGAKLFDTNILNRKMKSIDQLIKFLDNGRTNDADQLRKVLDKVDLPGLSKHSCIRLTTRPTKLIDFFDQLIPFNNYSERNEVKKILLEEKDSLVNKFLFLTSFQSFITILEECGTIYTVWTQLENFSAVAEYSKNNLNHILNSIEALVLDQTRLQNNMMKLFNAEMSQDNKQIVMKVLIKQSENLRKKVEQIRKEIESIKIKTNNCIEQLGVSRKDQNVRIATNLLDGGAGCHQLHASRDSTDNIWLIIKAILTLIQLVLIYFNYSNSIECKRKIAEFRQFLNEARILEDKLQELDNLLQTNQTHLTSRFDQEIPEDLQRYLNDLITSRIVTVN